MRKVDFALAILPIAVIIAYVAWVLGPWGCDARWDERTDWSVTAGCRVWTDQGWVPEDNYRVLD
jgi:hypothetical protein